MDDKIIPPGLNAKVDDFIRLYDHLKVKQGRKFPIMILGDRGVGKSLFVHIYETLYKKDNKNKRVKRINVSALSENLIESELFGYVKGAFTGATTNKKGLVEEADLLILEEIGDLNYNTQAKLLTFAEDNEFYQVGGTQPKKAKDLQIIATTNKSKDDMRPDFYDRFLKFRVPPLYERRGDVLYYMLWHSPDLIQHLSAYEIMTLLAHPWPGNVRELMAACLDMELFLIEVKKDASHLKSDFPLITSIKRENSDLDFKLCQRLYASVKMAGVDAELLESVLNKYNIGLYYLNEKKPLKKIEKVGHKLNLAAEKNERDKIFKTFTLQVVDEFKKVSDGIIFFSCLFHKNYCTPQNLMSIKKDHHLHILSPFKFIFKPTLAHDRLVKDLLVYCRGITLSEESRKEPWLDMDDENYWILVNEIPGIMTTEPEADSAAEKKDSEKNPFDMKRDDLLKAYCQYLLKKARTKKNAATLAGMNESTFYSLLKRSGLV